MKDEMIRKNVALGVLFQVYNRRIPAFWMGTLESVCSQIVIAGSHIGTMWKDPESRVLTNALSATANYAIGGSTLDATNMRSAQMAGPGGAERLAAPGTTLDPCERRAVLMSALVNDDLAELDKYWREARDDCIGGDVFGMTLLHWACALGCRNAFRWGVDKGLDVAGVSKLCWGCADLAKHNGHLELAAEAQIAGAPKLGVALAQACRMARASGS